MNNTMKYFILVTSLVHIYLLHINFDKTVLYKPGMLCLQQRQDVDAKEE